MLLNREQVSAREITTVLEWDSPSLLCQFPRSVSPSVGLLVSHRPLNESVSHVVLGRCGCVPHPSPAPTLTSLGLPTPHWKASWDSVKGCFPGGCDMCGVWVAVEGEQSLQEVVEELVNSTDLTVQAQTQRWCHRR